MNTLATIILFIFTAGILYLAFLGTIYLILKIQIYWKNHIRLCHRVYMKFIPHREPAILYKGGKLIDDTILKFEYKTFQFFLLSDTNKYIINSFTNKFQIGDVKNLNEREKRIFDNMQKGLLQDVLLKEVYYKELRESLQKEITIEP